jgi:hypothetical protein
VRFHSIRSVALIVAGVALTASSLSAQVQWSTTVNGQGWAPGMQVEVETCDTVQVVDSYLNSTGGPLPVELIQDFDSSEVAVVDSSASSGTVTQTSGQIEWSVTIPAGGSASLTIWFHAEPCNWPQSPLQRVWLGTGEHRDIVLVKHLADLQLGSVYEPLVFSGQQASFTLQYGNAGGYENAVAIWCAFPGEATYASASPPADFVDPGGLGAGWQAGDLANGSSGQIGVTVDIAPDLPIPTPLVIACTIHDHIDVVAQEALIELVTGARVVWERAVNGQPWVPGMIVEGETCDTVEVEEQLDNRSVGPAPVQLTQHFESSEIGYLDSVASNGVVEVAPGTIQWTVEVDAGQVETLVSHLHFDACTWTESMIVTLLSEGEEWRELLVVKVPPVLWIEPHYDPQVVSGQPAEFEIEYGNSGGYENDVEVWCEFPSEATYSSSVPPADFVDPSGLGAGWHVGDLAGDDVGAIVVTVEIDGGLDPETPIHIGCDLIDHTDVTVATASIDLVTVDAIAIFADGFESGDTSAWSATIP